MSTVMRLCLHYCTALPVQRYLITGAAASLVLALAVAPLLPLPVARALGGSVVPAGLTLIMFAAFFPLGWIFRAFSVPRSYRLMPWFRVKMLAALLIVVSLPGFIGGFFVFLTGAPAPIGPVMLYPTLMSSAVAWLLIFLPASSLAGLALLLVVVVAARVPEPQLEWLAATFGPHLAAFILLAGWGGFAVWYLRTMTVGPFPNPFRVLDNFDRRLSMHIPDSVSAEAAASVHVWRRMPTNARYWLAMFATGALIAGVITAVAMQDQVGLLATAMLVGTFAAFPVARDAGRRARLLWLRSAYSRAALFAVVEKGLMRTYLASFLVLVLTFMAALALFQGASLAFLWPIVFCCATSGFLGCQLGLMSVRGLGAFELAACGLWIATVAATAGAVLAWDPIPSYERLGPIAAVQLIGALGCRSVAARRWRSVDWLAFRAPRPGGMPSLAELLSGRS